MRFNDYINETVEMKDGIVNGNHGSLLLKIECFVIGVIVFIYSLAKGSGFSESITYALMVIIAIPPLLIFVPIFGYIWSVIASVFWGYLMYVYCYMEFDGVFGGIIGFIAVAGISFFFHVVALGLNGWKTLRTIHLKNEQSMVESLNNIEKNQSADTAIEQKPVETYEEVIEEPEESIVYVCYQCNKTIHYKQKFCGDCGSTLHAQCAKCGDELMPGVKFCSSCGSKLDR